MTAHASSPALGGRRLPAGLPLLRLALRLDAVVTGANALAYLALAGPVGDLLGMPPAALRGAGAFLAVFAGGVWWLGSRPAARPAGVRAVVGVNLAWVAASLAVLAAGTWSPTTAGTVWIALQAATVGGFAALQGVALRRAR